MATSITSPFFLANADDLLKRLEACPGPEARALAVEAQELTLMFRDWLTRRPSDDARVAGIGRLFDLNRRAMDLLAKVGPPSSNQRPAGGTTSEHAPPSDGGVPRLAEDEDEDDDD